MDKRSDNFWEAIYRQNIAKMIGVCCRYTQNRQTAEDLAHDAFVVAIGKVSTFENKGPFEAWLRRIVVNVALQYLREQKKHEKFIPTASYFSIYDDIPEENPVSENLTFSETELLAVINNLPEHQRLVFNLYVVDNFTHAQIAVELGISEGTSKSHLARARKKIRELLHDQLRENRERKRGILFLLFPYKLWNIDHLFADTLRGFSVLPERKFSLNRPDLNEATIPKYKPAVISNKIYLKTGIWGIATAVILTGSSNFYFNSKTKKDSSVISEVAIPTPDSFVELDSNTGGIDQSIFSDSMAATISDNPIIVEKTKNSEPMKNLNTLGGLLMASLSFNSTNPAKELPVQLKNRNIEVQAVSNSNVIAENGPAAEKLEVKLSRGTFYAQKLLWSETGKLYFLGDNVKVDFNTNRFIGSGRFSFLGDVNHLVINGTPLKMNEAINLSNKKYNLNQLNAAEGLKKYGKDGENGVVEITFAE
ncbi:MAG: RNA polymerase sigma factor [Dyadobacter sp.]|uniref:RNA polymerase sigma factor n=1 Tax=Dyadobacter sp. TaxID=1914288 RepID=UPI003264D8EA